MRTILFLIAALAVSTFAPDADAGGFFRGRSSCFTGHCVTPHVVKQFVHADPIVVREQIPVTTFNIVNNVPNALPLSPQGNSAYGYSSLSLSNYAQAVDPTLLFNQASKLTENAQQLAGQGFSQYSSLAAQQLQGQVAVAKVQAQGQAAVAALQAAQAEQSSSTTLQTFSFKATVDQAGKMTVEPVENHPADPGPAPNTDRVQLLSLVLENRCLRCHSGNDPKGGFSIGEGLTAEKLRKAQLHVLGFADPAMPPPSSDEGKAMTIEDRAAFLGEF
jgi:hypothetical protein